MHAAREFNLHHAACWGVAIDKREHNEMICTANLDSLESVCCRLKSVWLSLAVGLQGTNRPCARFAMSVQLLHRLDDPETEKTVASFDCVR